MKMNELINKVEQWAIDRNLHTASPKAQALKVIEEFTETLVELEGGDIEAISDGVGDTYVTLIILGQQLGINFRLAKGTSKSYYYSISKAAFRAINFLSTGLSKNNDMYTHSAYIQILAVLERVVKSYELSDEYCLNLAYNEIKDRKGKMVDGVFVKESDLHGDDS